VGFPINMYLRVYVHPNPLDLITLNIITTIFSSIHIEGRAVAQAVSRWLPTAAARVRVRAACGVCGG
jgi:hypothetical protein